MNTLPQFIARRRSIFPPSYTGERITEEKIDLLLEAANTAPTHKFTEPWRFKIYADAGKIRFFDFVISQLEAAGEPGTKVRKMELFKTKVSHVIALVMQRHEEAEIPEIEEICAVACAAQNMYLSLDTLEIAGYWSTGMFCFDEVMREFLQLQAGEQCLGFFITGVPQPDFQLPPLRRKPVANKIERRYE